MDYFEQAFPIVVGIEDAYTDDPHDPGNWTSGQMGKGICKGTKYGISAGAYPTLDIVNLTLDQAKAIYRRDYWQACACDKMGWPLCLFMFDSAVNQGQPAAKILLQTTLGVAVDGRIGPATLAAANRIDAEHLALFLTTRALRYMRAPNFALDGKGWFKRLFLIAMAK